MFDRKLEVVAYELLVGDGAVTDIAVESDAGDGSRRIIVNGVVDVDVAEVGDGKPVQLAVAPAVLESVSSELGPDQVMFVLGSGVDASSSTVAVLGELRARGFQVLLDDFAVNHHLHALLDLATAVRLDVGHGNALSFTKQVAVLKSAGVDLIADRVGSYEELRVAAKHGFDHFQGSFLSRPDGFRKNPISAGQLAALELVTLLMNTDAEIADIAAVVRRDVSLSYRILKVVNSARYSLARPLGSIEEAVRLVGTSQIASWVGMMSISQVSDKPSELTRVAMVRARACEALATHVDRTDVQSFHLAGLLSVVEALLDVPADQALRSLPISPDVADAIASRGGIMGEVLKAVVAYEEGDWANASVLGVPERAIGEAFHAAIVETDEVWSQVVA